MKVWVVRKVKMVWVVSVVRVIRALTMIQTIIFSTPSPSTKKCTTNADVVVWKGLGEQIIGYLGQK